MVNRLIKLFVSLVFFILASARNILCSTRGNGRQERCTVLLYHSIAPEDREQFARQMEEMLTLATPVNAVNAPAEIAKGRQVAVTFDDGLSSFRENALPELVKRKIPVTLFVMSRFPGKQPTFTEEYRLPSTEVVMSLEELLSLPVNLVGIGSHSQTHPHIPLLDRTAAESEIRESRTELEGMLKREVLAFAFPFGEYTDQALEWTRQAGYLRVFSALPGRNKKDDFLWGRIDTSPNDWLIEFKLKAIGAYRWLPWAVMVKQKLKRFLPEPSKLKNFTAGEN